ncbi:hypothetical protein D3C80_1914480 [compost metagenome]
MLAAKCLYNLIVMLLSSLQRHHNMHLTQIHIVIDVRILDNIIVSVNVRALQSFIINVGYCGNHRCAAQGACCSCHTHSTAGDC